MYVKRVTLLTEETFYIDGKKTQNQQKRYKIRCRFNFGECFVPGYSVAFILPLNSVEPGVIFISLSYITLYLP